MRVILVKDLKGRGKKGDIIDVNAGYAQNFLIKNNIAIEANNSNVNVNSNMKQSNDYHHAEEVKKWQAIADSLKNKNVICKLSVGENGKAFGSITKQEVLDKLKDYCKEIDKKHILDFAPIKALGTYKINLQFMKEVNLAITLQVIA